MNKIRFLMIGGFLGAGKTTTLSRLADNYRRRGLRVGLVTNDQATDLVDTHNLRRQGFDVQEVPGACFCCRFDDLISTMGRLGQDQTPDVILAEPVGSCTDLVATVVQPLKQLYPDRFEVGPYSVILKPSHGRRILREEEGSGFSPKAAYIFRKQLEEADAILLNRIDELASEEAEELTTLVKQVNGEVPILRISARTGQGVEALEQLLEQEGNFGRRILDLDYEIYAAGEAELGWLNSSLKLAAPQEFDLDELLLELVQSLRGQLAAHGAETAHLKVIGLWEGFFGVANLVSSDSRPELSLPSHSRVREADLIVNARVATDPSLLERLVNEAALQAAAARGGQIQFLQTQSFRPGRPVPTHRVSSAG
ncbi:MAG TPA: GTP-binding protein [Blastocatellia bacterium]|nr:GTP-binding protein [Blastocatellia bacterium]